MPGPPSAGLGPVVPKPFRQVDVFGHSGAADVGYLEEWGWVHILTEMLAPARLRWGARGGVVIGANNNISAVAGNTPYGWPYVLRELSRQDGYDPLNVATISSAAAGQATFTCSANFATNSNTPLIALIIDGANSEVVSIWSISGAGPYTMTLRAGSTLAYTHASGVKMVGWPAAAYNPRSALTVFDYAGNDYAITGPGPAADTGVVAAGNTPGFTPTINAMRTVMARARCALIFEENDPSVALGANWSLIGGAGTYDFEYASGGQFAQCGVAGSGSPITITVPPDVVAGQTLVFAFLSGSNGAGGNFTVSASGGAFASQAIDCHNASLFSAGQTRGAGAAANTRWITPHVLRVVTTINGPFTVTIVPTAIPAPSGGGTPTAFFDWWGIEASPPPLMVVLGQRRPLNYGIWTGWPYGASMVDADWAILNGLIRNLVAEFDADVLYIDLDSIINKNPAYFYADGAHLNEYGHALLARTLLQAITAKVIPSQKTITAQSPQKNTWLEIPTASLLNGWIVASSPAGLEPHPAVWRDPWQTVHIRGAVAAGGLATAIFNLGRSYRPRYAVPLKAYSDRGACTVEVQPNGDVVALEDCGVGFLKFYGSYLAEGV